MVTPRMGIIASVATGIVFAFGGNPAHATQEDDPKWDCVIMGNHLCGPNAERPNNQPIPRWAIAPHGGKVFGPYSREYRETLEAERRAQREYDKATQTTATESTVLWAICNDGVRTFSPPPATCTKHNGVKVWLR